GVRHIAAQAAIGRRIGRARRRARFRASVRRAENKAIHLVEDDLRTFKDRRPAKAVDMELTRPRQGRDPEYDYGYLLVHGFPSPIMSYRNLRRPSHPGGATVASWWLRLSASATK